MADVPLTERLRELVCLALFHLFERTVLGPMPLPIREEFARSFSQDTVHALARRAPWLRLPLDQSARLAGLRAEATEFYAPMPAVRADGVVLDPFELAVAEVLEQEYGMSLTPTQLGAILLTKRAWVALFVTWFDESRLLSRTAWPLPEETVADIAAAVSRLRETSGETLRRLDGAGAASEAGKGPSA